MFGAKISFAWIGKCVVFTAILAPGEEHLYSAIHCRSMISGVMKPQYLSLIALTSCAFSLQFLARNTSSLHIQPQPKHLSVRAEVLVYG